MSVLTNVRLGRWIGRWWTGAAVRRVARPKVEGVRADARAGRRTLEPEDRVLGLLGGGAKEREGRK